MKNFNSIHFSFSILIQNISWHWIYRSKGDWRYFGWTRAQPPEYFVVRPLLFSICVPITNQMNKRISNQTNDENLCKFVVLYQTSKTKSRRRRYCALLFLIISTQFSVHLYQFIILNNENKLMESFHHFCKKNNMINWFCVTKYKEKWGLFCWGKKEMFNQYDDKVSEIPYNIQHMFDIWNFLRVDLVDNPSNHVLYLFLLPFILDFLLEDLLQMYVEFSLKITFRIE